MATMIPRNKALQVAGKKIRLLSAKALESNLDAFCGTFGEAFQCGVEEAQGEILSRLMAVPATFVDPNRRKRPKAEGSSKIGSENTSGEKHGA